MSKKYIQLNDGQKLDFDEHRFCAILIRGRTISKKCSPLSVSIFDVLDETSWPMSFLEASQISSNHPDFNTIGVLAWWKVTINENHIWLHLESVISVKDKTHARDCLLDTTNADWCRKRYLSFFNTHPTIVQNISVATEAQ